MLKFLGLALSSLAALWLSPQPCSAQDIHEAIKKGDTSGVKAILERNPQSLNTPGENDRSPLIQSILSKQEEIFKLLLDGGADIERPDKTGLSPLHLVARDGLATWLDRLLRKGADINAPSKIIRATPLLMAVFGDSLPCVERLLQGGARPDLRDANGDTALLIAANRGRAEIVRRLLAKGASPQERGNENLTPLHRASFNGHQEVVAALIAAGAPLDALDERGSAALHYASLNGHESVVRALIDAGASLKAENIYHGTPLSIAVRDGREGIVAALRSAGAAGGDATAGVPEGDYLGQKAPGLTAEMFAPGIVSTEKGELNSVFTPDGNEFYFTIRNAQGRWTIMVMKRNGGRWTAPRPASFSGIYSDVDLFISPDGRKLLYCSNRAPDGKGEPRQDFDIWMVERVGADWSVPKNMGAPVNSGANEFYPALTGDGTLYFQSQRPGGLGTADIYRAGLREGAYREAENLGPPINSPGFEGDALIAPDESFLILSANRLGGFGRGDLLISFRGPDGSWSNPVNMGAAVNTKDNENCPILSPDGRYLFFTRADDIYWVSSGLIYDLKMKAPGETRPESAARALEALIAARGGEAAAAEYRKTIAGNERYSAVENELNALGYRYFYGGRVPEAVAVFVINTEAFPNSWNVWNSLGEAYREVGDREKSDACYAKSLALNPRDAAARDSLEETREPLRFKPGDKTGLKGLYFGQAPPGLVPKVFAPGIVSSYGHFDFSVTFSPDGREIYFTRRKDGERNALMVARLGQDGWTAPEAAAFAKGGPACEPHVTPDGRKLFYGSGPGIRVVDRTADGGWSEPRSHGPGMYATSARNGNLYMTDVTNVQGGGPAVIVYPRVDGGYGPPQRVGGGVNTPAVADHAFIAPDESYILFDSTRPGGQGGEGDLYVCFRKPDGGWGGAINLGDAVNNPGLNFCPSVSPDGKYIFFTTKRDIYWVSADILAPLRPKQ